MLTAYIDESGNTGQRLDDTNQPVVPTPDKQFSVAVMSILEDGREIVTHIKRHRKKDVKAELNTLPTDISDQKALFSDTGEFWGTVTEYDIGPQTFNA